MTRIIKIILILLITKISFSQENTVFNYNYPLEWNYNSFTLVYDNDEYLFSGGIAYSLESCPYWIIGHHITKINNQGIRDTIVVFGKCGRNIYSGYGESMSKYQSTISVVGGEYTDSLCKLFKLDLDENLDSISNFYFFNDTSTKRGWSMLSLSLTNSIICGQIDSTYNEVFTPTPNTTYTKSLLFEINETGNILWSKSYSFGDISDGCWSVFYRVIPTHDSGYIAIGITHDFGNRKALVVKTDSIGNLQWFRTYGNSSYHNPGFSDIIPTSDSCYIVCGAYTYGETFGGLYPYDGWIIKIDNDGNTVWDRKYRDYTVENTDWRDTIYNVFNSIVELEDGRIAAVATSHDGIIYGRKPKLYILSSVGDTIMTKLFEKPSYWYNPTTIELIDDGGFAIAGNGEFVEWNEEISSWESSQRIFLIKTDSLGNDTIISNISPIESKPITEFKLECYPNPASSEFFVELPQGIDDDVLEIYSTTGSLVWQQNVGVGTNSVGIFGLEPGMYLLRLKESGLYGKFVKE